MRYLTPRKLAENYGASGTGTEDHWAQTVSAAGLALMTPFVVVILGVALGKPREAVLAIFANPFVAVLFAVWLVVAMRHFARGAQNMLLDYVHGGLLKFAVVGTLLFSYLVMAVGLFALARIAL